MSILISIVPLPVKFILICFPLSGFVVVAKKLKLIFGGFLHFRLTNFSAFCLAGQATARMLSPVVLLRVRWHIWLQLCIAFEHEQWH
jgi:hypothetical protein